MSHLPGLCGDNLNTLEVSVTGSFQTIANSQVIVWKDLAKETSSELRLSNQNL